MEPVLRTTLGQCQALDLSVRAVHLQSSSAPSSWRRPCRVVCVASGKLDPSSATGQPDKSHAARAASASQPECIALCLCVALRLRSGARHRHAAGAQRRLRSGARHRHAAGAQHRLRSGARHRHATGAQHRLRSGARHRHAAVPSTGSGQQVPITGLSQVPDSGVQQVPYTGLGQVPTTQVSGAPSQSSSLTPTPAVSIFGEVAALRQAYQSELRLQMRASQPPSQQAVEQTPVSTTSEYHGRGTTCTICLEEFRPRDHVCRLECGHTFHAICVGEAAMHSNVMSDAGLMLECPNCRRTTQARSSWFYPDLPSVPAPSPVDEPTTPNNSGPSAAADSEEFRTPPEHAFPWRPVESHNTSDSAAGERPASESAYHSNVRLSDGRPGLLVDPGSFGNLAGERWLQEAAAPVNQTPTMQRRPLPLQVGGVGKGSQVCLDNCVLPLQMSRSDGSEVPGTFSSPVVQGSACPALLGLKTLQDNRAILNIRTLRLESAQSGHLLLPFSRSTQATASHHLFADDQPKLPAAACPQPCEVAGNAAESSALSAASIIEQAHLAHGKDQQVEVEEGMCANVLKNYNFDSASALLVKLLQRWEGEANATMHQRFPSYKGIAKCVGMYTHGGVVGITAITKQRPVFRS